MPEQSDGTGKRKVYAAAILAVKEAAHGRLVDYTLQAQAVVAWNRDDADMKARAWAKEAYPESAGFSSYYVQICELCEATLFNEFLAKTCEEWFEEWKDLKARDMLAIKEPDPDLVN